MATVQVIHISLLCCHVLHLNNCAAVLNHIRSTVKRQLYTDKVSRCGTLNIIIYQQSVHVYFRQSLNGGRASYLIFSAGYMHMCIRNYSAANQQTN